MNIMEEGLERSFDFPEVILVHRRLHPHDRQVLVVLGVAARHEDLVAQQR